MIRRLISIIWRLVMINLTNLACRTTSSTTCDAITRIIQRTVPLPDVSPTSPSSRWTGRSRPEVPRSTLRQPLSGTHRRLPGLELLNFYKAYRAMVRAKVALFSLGYQTDAVQRRRDPAPVPQLRQPGGKPQRHSLALAVTHGVSAVGRARWPCVWWRLLGARAPALGYRTQASVRRAAGTRQGPVRRRHL